MSQNALQSDELLNSCRNSIDILKKYIPWFEANRGVDHGPTCEDIFDENGRKCGICYTGDNLDATYSEFEHRFYHSTFYDPVYSLTTSRLLDQYHDFERAVSAVNLYEACAFLTFLTRGEHFCAGFLQDVVEDGSFLLVIKRIIYLVENGDVPSADLCTSAAPADEEKYRFTLISRTYIAGSKYIEIEADEYDDCFFFGYLNLIPEPENPYDANAVRIESAVGVKLGYLPREVNEIPSRLLAHGYELHARALRKIYTDKGCLYRISVLMFCKNTSQPKAE